MVTPNTHHRGVTLLEIVFAIALLSVIGMVSISALSEFRSRKTLEAGVEEVLTAFSRAHLDSISSKNDELYGVHLDADKVVYFIAPTYVAGTPTNIVFTLSNLIEIADPSANITASGNNIYFSHLRGVTTQSGTFDVRLKSNTTTKTTITVSGTGAVSL